MGWVIVGVTASQRVLVACRSPSPAQPSPQPEPAICPAPYPSSVPRLRSEHPSLASTHFLPVDELEQPCVPNPPLPFAFFLPCSLSGLHNSPRRPSPGVAYMNL